MSIASASIGLARVGVVSLGLLAAAARADVSSDQPLAADGFELAAGTSINGRGVWTDPRALFRVYTSSSAKDGKGSVRVDTTEFGDFNLPGYRNKWGGWIGFAQGAIGFAPAPGERGVLTLRGFVRITMPEHPYLRDVRVGILADDATNSTVADLGMDSHGWLGGVVQFNGNEAFWATAQPVAQPGVWNELLIRLDLENGLGRLEWNGNRVLVFSHNAGSIGRVQLSVEGRRSVSMPYRQQGFGEFDSFSATTAWHCEGDLNLDLVVDDEDFGDFVRLYDVGDCARVDILDASCAADLNGDLAVDEADFALFAARYDVFVCP
ncbi:MAG: hypothetical protein K2Y21_10835 [Phycisphaerales bacterium]|nr:hypothetical protein [Phycisphaerales bacterium]